MSTPAAVTAEATSIAPVVGRRQAGGPRVSKRALGYTLLVVLALVYVVGLALTGQTPGMRLLRLRVVPVTDSAPSVGLVPAALRTALLMLLIPALISDRDGRGLHDRAAGTVVVRA